MPIYILSLWCSLLPIDICCVCIFLISYPLFRQKRLFVPHFWNFNWIRFVACFRPSFSPHSFHRTQFNDARDVSGRWKTREAIKKGIDFTLLLVLTDKILNKKKQPHRRRHVLCPGELVVIDGAHASYLFHSTIAVKCLVLACKRGAS